MIISFWLLCGLLSCYMHIVRVLFNEYAVHQASVNLAKLAHLLVTPLPKTAFSRSYNQKSWDQSKYTSHWSTQVCTHFTCSSFVWKPHKFRAVSNLCNRLIHDCLRIQWVSNWWEPHKPFSTSTQKYIIKITKATAAKKRRCNGY